MSHLDNELEEFTTHAQVEAAAAVNAAEPPPMFPLEDCPLPAPYELDNQMDVTEDLAILDPEASGVMLTDEQLAEELYGPQKEPQPPSRRGGCKCAMHLLSHHAPTGA